MSKLELYQELEMAVSEYIEADGSVTQARMMAALEALQTKNSESLQKDGGIVAADETIQEPTKNSDGATTNPPAGASDVAGHRLPLQEGEE